MNFHEKAVVVKADVAAAVIECDRFCPSRYASIRTFGEPFGEPSLFGGSVHRMRSVLSD
jgi:hypothetical protein